MWISSGADQYKQKMNVMVASGDLPYFIPKSDPIIFQQLAEADLLADLTPYYDDYVSEMANTILTTQGPAVLEAGMVDSKLLALPMPNTAVDGAPMLWVKQDWIDKYGLESPKTMDDVIELAYFFTENDPDGNGEDDSFGLGVNKGLWGGFAGLEGFFNGFGAYPTIWHRDDSGNVVYGAVQPAAKEALAILAQMYADGVIDPEFGVKTGGKVGETAAQNKLGMEFGQSWNPVWPLNSNVDNDENAYWQAYPIAFKSDAPEKLQVSINISSYFAMRKGYEYPEVVYKLMNHNLEKGWGKTANPSEYGLSPEGIEKFHYSLLIIAPFAKNVTLYTKIIEALESGDSSKLNDEEKIYHDYCVLWQEGDRSQYSRWACFGFDSAYTVTKHYLDNDMLVYNELIGKPVDAWIDTGSTLKDLMLQDYTKIITGEEPIEYFDSFVKNWMALGGSTATEQMNARYPGQ